MRRRHRRLRRYSLPQQPASHHPSRVRMLLRLALPPSHDVESAPMQRPAARVDEGVAAHLVADTRVTPARPEPVHATTGAPEFPDDTPRPSITRIGGGGGGGGASAAAAGLAVAEPTDQKSHIERDPSVNKSLLLRLIAGVRGL